MMWIMMTPDERLAVRHAAQACPPEQQAILANLLERTRPKHRAGVPLVGGSWILRNEAWSFARPVSAGAAQDPPPPLTREVVAQLFAVQAQADEEGMLREEDPEAAPALSQETLIAWGRSMMGGDTSHMHDGEGLGGDSRPNGEVGDKEAPNNPPTPAPSLARAWGVVDRHGSLLEAWSEAAAYQDAKQFDAMLPHDSPHVVCAAVSAGDLEALVKQRDRLQTDVAQWVRAAVYATMPDEFGLVFDSTNPMAWAEARRAALDALLSRVAGAEADRGRLEALLDRIHDDVRDVVYGKGLGRHKPWGSCFLEIQRLHTQVTELTQALEAAQESVVAHVGDAVLEVPDGFTYTADVVREMMRRAATAAAPAPLTRAQVEQMRLSLMVLNGEHCRVRHMTRASLAQVLREAGVALEEEGV